MLAYVIYCCPKCRYRAYQWVELMHKEVEHPMESSVFKYLSSWWTPNAILPYSMYLNYIFQRSMWYFQGIYRFQRVQCFCRWTAHNIWQVCSNSSGIFALILLTIMWLLSHNLCLFPRWFCTPCWVSNNKIKSLNHNRWAIILSDIAAAHSHSKISVIRKQDSTYHASSINTHGVQYRMA